MRENLNRSAADLTTIRISDDVTLIRATPDGVHVMRAANHESAVVLLVVRGGEVEVWLYADGGIAARGTQWETK